MSVYHAIDAVVRCAKCGSVGVDTCKCWVKCECGWRHEPGKPCANPEHAMSIKGSAWRYKPLGPGLAVVWQPGYERLLWVAQTLRKATTCALCRRPLQPKTSAFAPLQQQLLNRSMRVCASHFRSR